MSHQRRGNRASGVLFGTFRWTFYTVLTYVTFSEDPERLLQTLILSMRRGSVPFVAGQ